MATNVGNGKEYFVMENKSHSENLAHKKLQSHKGSLALSNHTMSRWSLHENIM